MNDNAVRQTRRSGFIITVIATIFAFIYAVGVLKRSYWALAVPVTLATGGALYITLWIARALITTPAESVDE